MNGLIRVKWVLRRNYSLIRSIRIGWPSRREKGLKSRLLKGKNWPMGRETNE
jgi:hypothetical protein